MQIINEAELNTAKNLLDNEEVVAIPTETVYGLGANALSEKAVKKIYEVKGRPSDNPLIIHIFGKEDVEKYCADVSDDAYKIMDRFWPGPVTIVMKRKPIIPDFITAGLSTVAVRCPKTEITRKLLSMVDYPIAAPSANTSGRPSTTTVAHVLEDLEGKIPAVIDGGDCEFGLESTIIDMSEDVPVLLRPGAITLEELRALLGEVKVDKAVTSLLSDGETPRAPGMKYRHYAPASPLTMVRGDSEKTAEYIAEQNPGSDTGVLCFDEYKDMFPNAGAIFTFGSIGNKKEQGHELFDKLREFDKTKVKHIFAQCPDAEGIGLAITNRLSKAAAFDIVDVR